MANNRTMSTRIQVKRETEENWMKATNFIPMAGEIILYTDLKRIKFGDGTTLVNDLPFSDNDIWDKLNNLSATEYIDDGEGNITIVGSELSNNNIDIDQVVQAVLDALPVAEGVSF